MKIAKRQSARELLNNIPALTIAKLQADSKTKEVWVVNMCFLRGENARVLVNIQTRDGAISEVIPATWLPHNLTARVSKKEILESGDMRAATYGHGSHKPTLMLISTQDAELLLQHEGANDERERLNLAIVQANIAEDELQVSSRVLNILLQRETNQIRSARVAITSLESGDLTKDDLRHIAKDATDIEVKEWAATKLKS